MLFLPVTCSSLLSFQRPLTYIYQCPTSQLPQHLQISGLSLSLFILDLHWLLPFVCLIRSLCIIDLALSCFGEECCHIPLQMRAWGVVVFQQCLQMGFLSGKGVGCLS